MRKNYDFSKSKRNPYAKKMRSKKVMVQPEVSLSLADLLRLGDLPKKKEVEKQLKQLEKRIERLEGKTRRG